MLVLGIDGGGTSSEVVLAAMDGRVLAHVSTSGSNVRTEGSDRAIALLDRAISNALAEAGAVEADIASVCVGLAGISRAAERTPVTRWVAGRFPGAGVRLLTDVELVLAAGTPATSGLAIVSGTGSVAFGRDESGRTRRAGGRGPSLGDPGSGYAIGRAALQGVADTFDEIAPPGPLSMAILRHWPELSEDFDLAARSPSEVAGLTIVVADIADAGDRQALAILDAAGMDLARQGAAVLRALTWGPGPVATALAGGVLVQIPRVRTRLLGELERMGFEVSVEIVERPVLGAVRLATRLMEPAVIER